ncbi:putative aminoadipate reductase [Mycena vulgaris]|nr:putative aminoadipate reductase [Mycena vulgaris]
MSSLPDTSTLTLPEVLNVRMDDSPDSPMYVYAVEGEENITTISYLEFGRASHRASHALFPENTASQEVIALIGLVDTIVYQAISMGIIVAGSIPFPISPRNSPVAVANLLVTTSCHRILATKSTVHDLLSDVAVELAKNHPGFELTVEEMPSLQAIYPRLGKERPEDPFKRYLPIQPYSPLERVCIIFHSSGSTGLPKAIKHTYISLIHWAQFPAGAELRGEPYLPISSMALPPFHPFGMNYHLNLPLYSLLRVSVYPPTADPASGALPMAPTPASILDHTHRTNSNTLLTIPAMLQIWAQSPSALAHLKAIGLVMYSGGFLPPRLGGMLKAAGVNFRPAYGGTEFGGPTVVQLREGDEEEWAWMEFSSRARVRWVPQGDGTYECQFLTTDTHSLPVENLPDVRGYATADLWVRHPSKDYLWKLVGRLDDVIVHSTGEKTVPVPMEDVIITNPHIKGAVIFGARHSQSGLLVELVEDVEIQDDARASEWRNKIWPTIEEANETAPAFSKLFKEMILFCKPGRPLPRSAGKGNVVRKAALAEYSAEIEQLYDTVESTTRGENITLPDSWEAPDMLRWILVQAEDIIGNTTLSPSRDLFEQGFDSLSATILRRRITAAFHTLSNHSVEHIPHDIVYHHSSIADLADILARLAYTSELREEISDAECIEVMVERDSTAGWIHSDISEPKAPIVVFLTGSTGNLGADLLAQLVSNDQVAAVYAFNKPSKKNESLVSRHEKQFKAKGLDCALLKSEKIGFFEGDAAENQLGLDNLAYKRIQDNVTIIIHAAWRLDFNLALQSFKSNIHGTTNLIKMAQASRHATSLRFFFTSSVSSLQAWNAKEGLVPEGIIQDPHVAVGTGYGESKFVTEQIVSSSGLHSCSLRIGQMSGSRLAGTWPITNWFPMLVQASLKLGAIPDARGVISWIPVDAVAQSILELILSEKSLPPVLNIVHPHPITWSSMIGTLRTALIRAKGLEPDALQLVSFQHWFNLLENSPDSDLPALMLLDFYRHMAQGDAHMSDTNSEFAGMPSFDTTTPTFGIGSWIEALTPQEIERWVGSIISL